MVRRPFGKIGIWSSQRGAGTGQSPSQASTGGRRRNRAPGPSDAGRLQRFLLGRTAGGGHAIARERAARTWRTAQVPGGVRTARSDGRARVGCPPPPAAGNGPRGILINLDNTRQDRNFTEMPPRKEANGQEYAAFAGHQVARPRGRCGRHGAQRSFWCPHRTLEAATWWPSPLFWTTSSAAKA
eukprot:gene7677-biopygen13612